MELEPPPEHNSRRVNGNGQAEDRTSLAAGDLEQLLGKYRPWLRSLAEAELPRALQAKLDPSDLVQETLLRGFRAYGQYRGTTERELTAWLTEILQNHLADVQRGWHRGVRDVRREQPLPEVACPQGASASDLARRTESSERLQQAMTQLSDEHRTVLEYRQFHELTFPEIGQRMGRTADAVRMLWGRAILHLGKRLRDDDG